MDKHYYDPKYENFFENEKKYVEIFEKIRWPNGVVCGRCESTNCNKNIIRWAPQKKRIVYSCYECQYQFTVITNSIFHNSHVALSKWFKFIRIVFSPLQETWTIPELCRELKLKDKAIYRVLNIVYEALKDPYKKEILIKMNQSEKQVKFNNIKPIEPYYDKNPDFYKKFKEQNTKLEQISRRSL